MQRTKRNEIDHITMKLYEQLTHTHPLTPQEFIEVVSEALHQQREWGTLAAAVQVDELKAENHELREVLLCQLKST